MAQQKGFVNENAEAVVKIELINGSQIECVLDTGFNGNLILPKTFLEANSVFAFTNVQVQLAEGKTAFLDVATVLIKWLADEFVINILVSENDEALIGTQMLIGCLLEIDYVAETVKISKI